MRKPYLQSVNTFITGAKQNRKRTFYSGQQSAHENQGFPAPKSIEVQLGQRAAIYCRVSTIDQSCERQERDLISVRGKSGLASAKARGKKLGRQAGERPKSDRLLPKVATLRAEGRSYRWIAYDLGISKNTVDVQLEPSSSSSLFDAPQAC